MVIKNKEERSTAIWRFISVAAILLLLLFFAGFSIGNTAGKEKGNLSKLLEEERTKSAACAEQLKSYQAFFKRGDAIVAGISEQVGNLDKKLREITPLPDNIQLIADWDKDVYKFFYGIDRDMAEIESDWVEKNPKDSVIQIGFKYFKEYRDNNKLRLMTQKIILTGNLEDGMKQGITQMQDDMKKQNEDAAKAIKEERNALDLAKIQNKLEACETKLAQCQQGSSEKPDNKSKKEKIDAEVNKILTEVIPNMQTRWIGNDQKKIDKLKDQLRGNLDAIQKAAGAIQ